jgi:tetratricopeptide (TPR) repeat protein
MRRALEIDERGFGADHPNVARDLHNLSSLLADARRLAEAEPLIRRALASDERSLGNDHPMVAMHLNELAQELQAANRLAEAEPLLRRSVEILVRSSRSAGHPHPHLYAAANNYGGILEAMGRSREDIIAVLQRLAPELFQGA